MIEDRLFEGDAPEWTTPGWYAGRDHAPHLEQGGHRERLVLAAGMVGQAVGAGATYVCDLGAGDGGLLSLVSPGVARVGYDLQQTNVDAAARRGVNVELRDFVADFPADDVDCFVATEVLEHLVDPHAMVDRFTESAAQWVVASSPYTETAASHYEFHTWAWDAEGYARMFTDRGWRVVRHEFAWICQVMLCERAP